MTALGVDIGGTRIKAGIVDGNGKVLRHNATPTPVDLEGFTAALHGLIGELACDTGDFIGVGIGCKGIIDPLTTRVEVLPGTCWFLEGVVLSELVFPSLPRPLPISADNDARVAMAGEMVWGAARGHSHALMLTLGTGVGGALVAGGKLVRGAGGVAGHLGHIVVDPEGPVCMCGNRGCLETQFSALSIEAEAFDIVHRQVSSKLTDRYRNDPLRITCKAVFDAAAEGDEVAMRIRDRAIAKLGAALAGMLFAFDPGVAIVGGQIAESGPCLFEPLREEVWRRTRRYLRREVPIVPPQVTDKSGVVGGAALVFHGEGAGAD